MGLRLGNSQKNPRIRARRLVENIQSRVVRFVLHDRLKIKNKKIMEDQMNCWKCGKQMGGNYYHTHEGCFCNDCMREKIADPRDLEIERERAEAQAEMEARIKKSGMKPLVIDPRYFR